MTASGIAALARIHRHHIHEAGGVVDPDDEGLDALQRHEQHQAPAASASAAIQPAPATPRRARTTAPPLGARVGIPGGGLGEVALERSIASSWLRASCGLPWRHRRRRD